MTDAKRKEVVEILESLYNGLDESDRESLGIKGTIAAVISSVHAEYAEQLLAEIQPLMGKVIQELKDAGAGGSIH